MLRWIVRIAVIILIGLIAFVVLAPLAPDGSGLSDARDAFVDGLKAWWGNPITP
ncbi:MAG TPA: hypothetical protein VLT15_10340 [Acidimicrobiia bacterium]|nr:hypothetical protein [Acidimicrobiia bacterium]